MNDADAVQAIGFSMPHVAQIVMRLKEASDRLGNRPRRVRIDVREWLLALREFGVEAPKVAQRGCFPVWMPWGEVEVYSA